MPGTQFVIVFFAIKAYGILPYQSEPFLRLGFLPLESRRVMIRPTEIFAPLDWEERFNVLPSSQEHIDKIAELCFEAYSGPDSIGYPEENTVEKQKAALESYYQHNQIDILTKASCLIYDKKTNQMVAVCLISLWGDLPLVSNIAVLPEYRGNRLAVGLLKKALTVLNEQYDVLRLFVTIGNSAESLYYNLGFYPGFQQTTFHLPLRSS